MIPRSLIQFRKEIFINRLRPRKIPRVSDECNSITQAYVYALGSYRV